MPHRIAPDQSAPQTSPMGKPIGESNTPSPHRGDAMPPNAVRNREPAYGGQGGRSVGPEMIGRPEKNAKLSDSHNYRRAFELEGEDLLDLGIASRSGDQDRLNAFWLGLGGRLGFVWTTVADLDVRDRAKPGRDDGPDEVVTFTAEVEGEVPAIPAFETWLASAGYDPAPALREFGYAAFEAGSRHAALTLAQLEPTGLTGDALKAHDRRWARTVYGMMIAGFLGGIYAGTLIAPLL